jgi:beta-N-acetylglucosaminidase
MHDRNYYRMLSNAELVDQVRYGTDVNWHELAIVLAERLEMVREDILDEIEGS